MAEYPEEGELVLATVTKIHFHSVFCNLDDYGKSAMIHISEIAPGRIRNISDYLKEGKSIVAKVLKIDKEKGHIDLSLRRVTPSQRKAKAAEIKSMSIVDNIVVQAAKELKVDAKKLTEELEAALRDYHTLYDAFQAVVEENLSLEKASVSKKLAGVLEKLIRERIKEKSVSIKGEFNITSYAPDGVELIKKSFGGVPDNINITYLGGGRYGITIATKDYKIAESQLQTLMENVKEGMGEAEVKFERTDK